jgi:hypothetical protein
MFDSSSREKGDQAYVTTTEQVEPNKRHFTKRHTKNFRDTVISVFFNNLGRQKVQIERYPEPKVVRPGRPLRQQAGGRFLRD